MDRFPLDIVHLILEYVGYMKYRNGKYMNQLAQDDKRYFMLLKIPRIEPTVIGGWRITIKSMDYYGDKKSIYCNKYVCPYSKDEPLITVNANKSINFYNYYQQGYCYNWTVYNLM